jgi:N-acyl-D-amino-acid deacylase
MKRLQSKEHRARVTNDLNVTGSDGNQGGVVNWPAITVAGINKDHNLKFVGKSMIECAAMVNKDVTEFYLDFIADEELKASCIIFSGHEGNVRAIMQDRRHMIGSDGILTGNRPHPRSYGTFARYLGVYAREEKVLSFEGAVARMTGRSAKRLGLKDRGLIKEGFNADLVLLDANTVLDRSTYESPRLAAAGIENVWIGGVATLKDGKRTEALPGRAIRSR